MKKLAHLLPYSSSPLHLSLTIFTSYSTTFISPDISEHLRVESRRERRASGATKLDSWSVMRLIGDGEGASGVEKKVKFYEITKLRKMI
jgi:hypothetical protein